MLLRPQPCSRERCLQLRASPHQVRAPLYLDNGAAPADLGILRRLDDEIRSVAAAHAALQVIEVQHELLGSHSRYTMVCPAERQKIPLQ